MVSPYEPRPDSSDEFLGASHLIFASDITLHTMVLFVGNLYNSRLDCT